MNLELNNLKSFANFKRFNYKTRRFAKNGNILHYNYYRVNFQSIRVTILSKSIMTVSIIFKSMWN